MAAATGPSAPGLFRFAPYTGPMLPGVHPFPVLTKLHTLGRSRTALPSMITADARVGNRAESTLNPSRFFVSTFSAPSRISAVADAGSPGVSRSNKSQYADERE